MDNPAAQNQPKELQSIDALKEKLLGTDRTDHWETVLDMEKDIKRELLKKDIANHQGMKLLLDWMINMVKEGNELLRRAKSKELTNAERDGLIERVEFIEALIKFLDPKGVRLSELRKELEYQLEEPEEESDEIPADMLSTDEDPTAPRPVEEKK